MDKRRRKPFDTARQVAHAASGGYVGYGGKYTGEVSLTIATNDWTETVTAQSDSDVAALLALNGLLQQAKSGPPAQEESASVLPTSSAPAAPSDIAGALRDLKDLHDQGFLTDDEYEPRRQALISQLPSAGSSSTPAGWHPDPHGVARLRWWDGSTWSEHTAP